MATARYVLPDEPRPGALAQLAVDPIWPLLASMLVGLWLGLAWFAVNSLALGSPTWRREFGLMLLALAGSALLLFVIAYCAGAKLIEPRVVDYAMLSIVALRLACMYGIQLAQTRTHELFTYFGNKTQNGGIVLMVALLAVKPVVDPLISKGVLGILLR